MSDGDESEIPESPLAEDADEAEPEPEEAVQPEPALKKIKEDDPTTWRGKPASLPCRPISLLSLACGCLGRSPVAVRSPKPARANARVYGLVRHLRVVDPHTCIHFANRLRRSSDPCAAPLLICPSRCLLQRCSWRATFVKAAARAAQRRASSSSSACVATCSCTMITRWRKGAHSSTHLNE